MIMANKERIHALAKEYADEIVSIRRHIHQNPELSYQEFETSTFIQSKLTEFGIEFQHGVANTGIVGYIKGKNPDKKVVALRADIDALPIYEKNDVPYKSRNEGVMHACGHDVHTASLLGASKILNEIKDEFEGTVKLIFQPGEEKLPGGASIMIKEGVLKNPKPDNIVGQHVMPLIDAGKVGFRSGMYMASADEIYLTVHGKGGHAALPESNIDPILIASHILVALQQIISRNASPKIPSVLSFGKITGMGATNVIPDEVKIEGTFRTMNEVWRKDAHQKIKHMAESIAYGMGGSCEVDIRVGYPFLKNAPELADQLKGFAQEYLGEENVEDLDLWMAAEDFAYYSQEIDACFYRLGIKNEEQGIVSGLHTPTFNIDESALEVGAGLMAYLTFRQLQDVQ
jgi:amidohydrolase